jgi:hypothetical protein
VILQRAEAATELDMLLGRKALFWEEKQMKLQQLLSDELHRSRTKCAGNVQADDFSTDRPAKRHYADFVQTILPRIRQSLSGIAAFWTASNSSSQKNAR